MSIFLYQIGMDRITATPTSFAGLQVNMPRTFKVDAVQSGQSPKVFFNGFTQFPEPLELELTGTFICSNCDSVSDQFSRLLSMAGKPYVDVIGYLPNDCCCVGNSCGVCGNCSGDKPVTWLTTTGTITFVDRNYEISSGTPYPGSVMEVSFKMILDAYWQPMNPYIWYPQYDAALPYDSFHREVALSKAILPPQIPANGNLVFYKRIYEDPNLLLNSDVFEGMFSPENAYGKNFFKPQNGKFKYRVRPSRSRWSAPPSSIYVARFKFDVNKATASPVIRVTVESEISPFNTDTFVSSANGSGPIATVRNDIVFGDSLYGPVYAIPREPYSEEDYNSQTLTFINAMTSKWSYPTSYPGELLGVDNIITIEVFNSDIEIAFLHTFRSL